jgi:hypothetical protein
MVIIQISFTEKIIQSSWLPILGTISGKKKRGFLILCQVLIYESSYFLHRVKKIILPKIDTKCLFSNIEKLVF